MANLIDVKNLVVSFLRENTSSDEVTVIRIDKVSNGWKCVAEVYEDDSFLKSMNLPPKKTRLFYAVAVDADLEITSFHRLSSYHDDDEQAD